MKAAFFLFSLLFLHTNLQAQQVIAGGQQPAWVLDYDGASTFMLYVGENSFAYTLAAEPKPEGSSTEIAESWILVGENGKTATLVIEYFDPESAESCPCFHDFGEGLNAGKAYLITENKQFYIGCAEFTDEQVVYSEY